MAELVLNDGQQTAVDAIRGGVNVSMMFLPDACLWHRGWQSQEQQAAASSAAADFLC